MINETLQTLIDRVAVLDTTAMAACRTRIDNLTKPLGSLHMLEFMAERLAGIQGNEKPGELKKAVVIFAADHAVNGGENYTQGKESLEKAKRIAAGKAPVNAAAHQVKAGVLLVDMGLQQPLEETTGVISHKVMKGSRFFGKEDAMNSRETMDSILFGARLAQQLAEEGYQAVGLGNVGERAILSALAITAAFFRDKLQEMPAQIEGKEKIEQLAKLFASRSWNRKDPLGLLQIAGAPDIAAMTGFVLGAAAHRMVIVFDNAVTGAAVLIARTLCHRIDSYVYPSVAYNEPVHQMQMNRMGLKPYLYYDMDAEEGLGSALGLSLLDAAVHMLNDMKTFGEAAVAVAEDGPGKERQTGI